MIVPLHRFPSIPIRIAEHRLLLAYNLTTICPSLEPTKAVGHSHSPTKHKIHVLHCSNIPSASFVARIFRHSHLANGGLYLANIATVYLNFPGNWNVVLDVVEVENYYAKFIAIWVYLRLQNVHAYHIKEKLPWSAVFEKVEELEESHAFSHVMVQDTNLEQIFIAFAEKKGAASRTWAALVFWDFISFFNYLWKQTNFTNSPDTLAAP